tara:strand:- start:4153 stop:4509 length:357 start_codon:yes stop_codon:yes gene_type:complete
MPIPQWWGINALDLGWPGRAVFQSDALAQFLQIRAPGLTLHQNQIGFGKVKPRTADARLQTAVISQQQQAFRIPVQSSRRVHVRLGDEFAQRSATLIVAKLGQHLKGFVEQDQLRHGA